MMLDPGANPVAVHLGAGHVDEGSGRVRSAQVVRESRRIVAEHECAPQRELSGAYAHQRLLSVWRQRLPVSRLDVHAAPNGQPGTGGQQPLDVPCAQATLPGLTGGDQPVLVIDQGAGGEEHHASMWRARSAVRSIGVVLWTMVGRHVA